MGNVIYWKGNKKKKPSITTKIIYLSPVRSSWLFLTVQETRQCAFVPCEGGVRKQRSTL